MATTTASKTEAVSHLLVVEVENASGGRYWAGPMTSDELQEFTANKAGISDVDCWVECPCTS